VVVQMNELSTSISELQSEQAVYKRQELVIGDVQQADALVRAVGGVQRTGTCVRRQGFTCRTVMPGAIFQRSIGGNDGHPTSDDLGLAVHPANCNGQTRADSK
jgi:hypothetical protein